MHFLNSRGCVTWDDKEVVDKLVKLTPSLAGQSGRYKSRLPRYF